MTRAHRPAKILIVEDDEMLLSALNTKLKKEGFETILAQNGQEALNLISYGPDLILLDILMPVMDGLEFYNRLKTKLQRDIPTIIMTNLAETTYPTDVKEFLNKSTTSLDQIVEKIKLYTGNIA